MIKIKPKIKTKSAPFRLNSSNSSYISTHTGEEIDAAVSSHLESASIIDDGKTLVLNGVLNDVPVELKFTPGGGGGGEPEKYIKDAETSITSSSIKLTLTKKNDDTVNYAIDALDSIDINDIFN